jgi:hypothetical protein
MDLGPLVGVIRRLQIQEAVEAAWVRLLGAVRRASEPRQREWLITLALVGGPSMVERLLSDYDHSMSSGSTDG